MSNPTPNLNLPSPIGSEYMSRAYFVELVNSIDTNAASKAALETLRNQLSESSGFGTAQQPVANKYTLTLNPAPTKYSLNMRLTVKIPSSNTGPATINVNGLGEKTIKRSNGTDLVFNTLKAGGVYALVYDGTNFTLLGEGGEYGTATAADVLAPKTIGTDDGIVTGTMPDNSTALSTPLSAERSWNGTFFDILVTPKKGYFSGQYPSVIVVSEPNFQQKNIRAGVTMFGAPGDENVVDTLNATATKDKILWNESAYVKGQYLRGEMLNNTIDMLGNSTFREAASVKSATGKLYVAPTAGYYDSRVDAGGYGKVQVSDANFKKENILAGVPMFGMVGTGGQIKNIVRGTAQFQSLNLTSSAISPAIVPENSILFFTVTSSSSNPRQHKVRGSITSSTAVQFYVRDTSGGTTVRWTVIEFHPGAVKQKFSGEVQRLVGNAYHTVTLPQVVSASKALIFASYSTEGTNVQVPGYFDAVAIMSGSRDLLLMGANLALTENVIETWFYQVLELN